MAHGAVNDRRGCAGRSRPRPTAPWSDDPATRRGMTDDRPLAEVFRRLIRTHGPISLAHFMAESNARYYAAKDPLGTGGDFITAPEISQMFGELVGLWLADLW